MGKKPKSKPKPSFFKIMLGDFTHQLQIPPRFVLHYNDVLSNKLLLKTSCGDFWAVKLKEEKHEMFFGEGWSGFVKDNSLEFGDLLVFRSLGNSNVYVKIYSKDCCEKRREKGKKLETSNTNNNQLSTRRSFRSKLKSNDACQIKKKDNRHVSCIGGSSLKQSRVTLNKMKKRKSERGFADRKIMNRDEGNGPGKRSKNSDAEFELASSTDEKVVSVSKNADSSDEDVVSVRKDADSIDEVVERSSNKDVEVDLSVSIDADSTDEEAGLSISEDVDSTDEEVDLSVNEATDSTDEETDLSVSHDTDSTYEINGVSISGDVNSTDEEVELGVSEDADSTDDERDELISSKHANSTDKEVQSHGFKRRTRSYHRNESRPQVTTKYWTLSDSKRKPVTRPKTGQSTNAASRFKSKYPFFIVHLGSAYVKAGFLHIPMDFADKYLPEISTNACILDSSERTWIVQYILKKRRTYFGKHLESGKACFSKGWKELVVANELKVGYVCAFELIDRKNVKLKISILSKKVIK